MLYDSILNCLYCVEIIAIFCDEIFGKVSHFFFFFETLICNWIIHIDPLRNECTHSNKNFSRKLRTLIIKLLIIFSDSTKALNVIKFHKAKSKQSIFYIMNVWVETNFRVFDKSDIGFHSSFQRQTKRKSTIRIWTSIHKNNSYTLWIIYPLSDGSANATTVSDSSYFLIKITVFTCVNSTWTP